MRDVEISRSEAPAGDAAGCSSGAPGKATLSERLYRKARGEPSSAAGDALSGLGGSSGAPLPEAARTRFEAGAGADLSDVRVHTGPSSAAAAD